MVYAESVTVQPKPLSNNEIEVNENDYSINGVKTTINDEETYNAIYGGWDYKIRNRNYYATIKGNTVTINGIVAIPVVYGGYSQGDATGNSVTVYSGTISAVYGSSSYFDATNNTVIINGGIIDVVTGGGASVIGTNGSLITNSASVSGNTVTINGGRINGMSNENYDNIGVIGGISLTDDSTNNTVNINGGKINGNVYGGWSNELKKALQMGGDYMDISSSILNNATGGNISGSTSNNGVINPLESLTSNVTLNPQTKVLTVSRLPVVLPDIPTLPDLEPFAEFDLSFDGKTEGSFDSKTESSDTEETAEEKKETGVASTPAHKGCEIFADMGGGSMKYKTGDGSYVDTKTQNADLGFARNVGNMANKVTIAPVIDYQKSDFDSYLKDGTHGNGTTKYTGGGFVLRGMNHNGFYYEGSFRAGRAKTDFASDNLDTTGFFGRVTYDTTATVLNGHVKFGKYLRLNKNNILDVYSTYYHSHQNGTNTDLSSGEHYDFSSADAGKLRIGYRLTTKTSRISQIYTGLAYQYDYNSGVTGTYKGYSTPSTKHSGSSGMIELGWQVKPLKNVPWMVDINATGWVGNQRGIKALAKVQKSF